MGRYGKLIVAFLVGAFLGPKLIEALEALKPKEPKVQDQQKAEG